MFASDSLRGIATAWARHDAAMSRDGVEYVDIPIYRDELAQALHFNPSDLQQNRAGRLSVSQRSTQLVARRRCWDRVESRGFRAGERQIPIQVGLVRTTAWTYCWIVDGTQRFWVAGKVYPVLTPARHRLYFLPTCRRILAAEPI